MPRLPGQAKMGFWGCVKEGVKGVLMPAGVYSAQTRKESTRESIASNEAIADYTLYI